MKKNIYSELSAAVDENLCEKNDLAKSRMS